MRNSLFRIGLLLLAGAFVMGQFGRFELGMGRAIYIQDVLLVCCSAVVWRGKELQLWNRISRSRLGMLWAMFVLWIIFTTLIHFHNNIPQLVTIAFYLIRFHAILLFAASLYEGVKQRVLRPRDLSIGVASVGGLLAVCGWIQYFLFPDTRNLHLLGWDDHYYRLIGTIFDPGFMGMLLVLCFGFCLLKLYQTKKSWVLYTAVACCSFTALLFTYSRASYLAFIVMVFFLSWKMRKGLLLSVLAVFGIGIVLLPRPGGEGVKLERTASAVSRIESVQTATQGIGIRELLIGKGFYNKKVTESESTVGAITVPNHSSAAENSYIFVLTSLGVVGLLLFFALVWEVGKQCAWSGEVGAGLIAISVHAVFSNTWFHSFVLLFFACIVVDTMVRRLPSAPERSQ